MKLKESKPKLERPKSKTLIPKIQRINVLKQSRKIPLRRQKVQSPIRVIALNALLLYVDSEIVYYVIVHYL